jgi:hypothetical protein
MWLLFLLARYFYGNETCIFYFIKRSSLQKSVIKFMPKLFYEIDPRGLYYKMFAAVFYYLL